MHGQPHIRFKLNSFEVHCFWKYLNKYVKYGMDIQCQEASGVCFCGWAHSVYCNCNINIHAKTIDATNCRFSSVPVMKLNLWLWTQAPDRPVLNLSVFAGGHGTLLGLINSFVHIIMYSYYLLAALGPSVQKYLWWKKYITTMQMVRHVCDCRVGYKTAYLLHRCVLTCIGCILLRYKLLYCRQNTGKLVTLTSLSQIKYLLLVLSYEAEGTQEMSTKSGVIKESQRFFSLCLLLYYPQSHSLHKYPLSWTRKIILQTVWQNCHNGFVEIGGILLEENSHSSRPI